MAVALSRPEEALASFEFRYGALRGSRLLLHPACLIHRGSAQLDTLPLAAIAAVRVTFERSFRKIGWGAGLLLGALVLFALSAPLSTLAADAAGEMAPHLNPEAGGQGIAAALHAIFRALEALANLLPALAVALTLAGVAMAVLGWLGQTRLTVGVGSAERSFAVPGRNAELLQFAEALSARAVECAEPGAR